MEAPKFKVSYDGAGLVGITEIETDAAGNVLEKATVEVSVLLIMEAIVSGSNNTLLKEIEPYAEMLIKLVPKTA